MKEDFKDVNTPLGLRPRRIFTTTYYCILLPTTSIATTYVPTYVPTYLPTYLLPTTTYYPPGPQAQRRVDILKYLFHLSKEEKNPLLVLPQRDGYTIKCTYTWVSQKKSLCFTRQNRDLLSGPDSCLIVL